MNNALKLVKLIPLWLFFSALDANGQPNLVPNPSFEEMSGCPESINRLDSLLHWFSPSVTTPELFSTCSPSIDVQVPLNFIGNQEAKTDSSYIGIANFRQETGREYVSVKLIDTLIADSTYCVTFYVSPADSALHFSDEVGVHFSFNPLSSSTNDAFLLPSHVKNPDGVFLDDTAAWMEVSGLYTATGNEVYMTIGTFSNAMDIVMSGNPTKTTYLYIDDVSVVQCNTQRIQESFSQNSVNLFPNPNNGTFMVDVTTPGHYTLALYGSGGRKVKEVPVYGGEQANINLTENFASGMYLWIVFDNESIIQRGKLIVE